MRILLLLSLVSLFTIQALDAQIRDSLTNNNIKAQVDAYGELFNKEGQRPGFEAPRGSGLHSIFLNSIWIGGISEDNDLHLAAQTYRNTGGSGRNSDFAPGPSAEDYNQIYRDRYQRVWGISRKTVEQHKAQFDDPNYTVPNIIEDWPAQKDTSLGIDHHPAPFVDSNDNGKYDPANGDYPKIRGDRAILFIVNDGQGPQNETNGRQMNIEIQGMVYSYDSAQNPALNHTIFVNYRIRNQSDNDYRDVYLGNFTDFDLGYPFDDYVGCDTQSDLYYAYNGDTNDEGVNGYGFLPPAMGGTFLSTPLNSFVYYTNDFTEQGNPRQVNQYYNYLQGTWKDSTPMTVGGDGYKASNDTTRYLFFGNPRKDGQWHEKNEGNQPGDRRGLGVAGPFEYEAGSSECLDMAFLFARDSTRNDSNSYVKSITKLKNRRQAIKQFYEQQNFNCEPIETSDPPANTEQSAKKQAITIYPNPAEEQVSIKLPQEHKKPLNFQLMNTKGQTLIDRTIPAGESNFYVRVKHLKPGFYPIHIQNDTNSYRAKLMTY